MNLLQRVHALLQIDVVGGELGLGASWQLALVRWQDFRSAHLVIDLAQLLFGILEGPRGERRDLSTEAPALGLALELSQQGRRQAGKGAAYVKLFPIFLKSMVAADGSVLIEVAGEMDREWKSTAVKSAVNRVQELCTLLQSRRDCRPRCFSAQRVAGGALVDAALRQQCQKPRDGSAACSIGGSFYTPFVGRRLSVVTQMTIVTPY